MQNGGFGRMIRPEFWRDKVVLVTGHTGFKGSWLSIWLDYMGAKVVGYSAGKSNNKNSNFYKSNISNKIIDIRGDIREDNRLKDVFRKHKPEIVFHLAAQPLVKLSYEVPEETYETNVIGTLNVLQCIREFGSVKSAIMVTSDKCYLNKERGRNYKETDPLGGYDPYSGSKACAEILISTYRSSFMNPKDYKLHGKAVASVRAGNVIGGGDWAKNRILPDCIRAIEGKKEILIRSPRSIRPWQYVLDVLFGYLLLAEKLYQEPQRYSQAWNFGPSIDAECTVLELVNKVIASYGQGTCRSDESQSSFHEAKVLCLDTTKTNDELGWHSKYSIDETIKATVDWYKNYKDRNVYEICIKQIEEYMLT